jgi:aspartyl-tRNA(Asn)/glutamyl-tRNA(Gln) amidotransferase subunit B
MTREPVIGLEVHVHLNTQSKLFCACRNVSESPEPNRFVCPVCMGFPGALPVANRQAIEWAIHIGLALGCTIASHAIFARKSYFYPDLPKGYQISQYEEPLCKDGRVRVFAGETEREIQIVRAHLEEDAAKNVHDRAHGTLVDFTRSGTPLVEIVTAPDVHDPAEAKVFLEDLQRTMRYLGVSNADMEHGDLRVDANISLREPGGPLHPKTEIKNLNSFRAVERALQYERARQDALWDAGTIPTQSTRGWDDTNQRTVEQRVKEGEADYRYFPEPDIPPLQVTDDVIERLRASLPELPHEKEERFRRQFRLPVAHAHLLVEDRNLAAYAENVFSEIEAWNADRADVPARDTETLVKLAANYLLGDFRSVLADAGVAPDRTLVSAENFAELIVMLHRAEVNRNAIPDVLREMHRTGGDASTIVTEKGWTQVSGEDELRRIVQDILAENPSEAEKVRAGKTQVLQFLVGKVMAQTKGRANPQKVQELLRGALGAG